MRKGDKIIRYIAFYLALALYIILLPIMLSYSLGYHIDFHKFKIYKTGILALKSEPAGASIYINSKPYRDITPARIEELKPGTYTVEVRIEGFYPWQKELTIRPNMVTLAEHIVLFPVLQDILEVSALDTKNFFMPEDRSAVYYMARDGFYKTNSDGSNTKKLSSYSSWPAVIKEKKFSPDEKKVVYFNDKNIWVIYLNGTENGKKDPQAVIENVFEGYGPITDVFWYSQSNHLVFIDGREINVVELGREGEESVVTLHKCRRPPQGVFYDEYNDSLYFCDSGGDGNRLYRIDLREQFYDKLMERVKKEFDVIYEKK